MNSFYEEIIPLKDLKPQQDANKFFINEDLTEVERINYIFKKGNITQKCAFLNRLPDMINNLEIFKTFVEHTIDNMDMWKSQLLIAFANSLNMSIINITKLKLETESEGSKSKKYAALINTIIKFFINTIASEAKETCDEFIKNFNEFIEVLNKEFRIDLDKEIIDLASSLGSFSNPSFLRRYSAYFCSSLIRIEVKSNHNENLIKRFIILSSDPEFTVRLEISYHIRYVIEELDEATIKKHFIKIFDEYIIENDIIARSEFLNSLILNVDKVILVDYIQKLIGKTLNFLESDYNASKNFECVCKVFRTIVSYIQNLPQYQKYFLDLIKVYLKKYFIVFEKENTQNIEREFIYDYLIEDFDYISRILKKNNENNFWTDFFNYLIRQVFENVYPISEDNQDVSINTIKSNCNKDYKLIFFKNFDKVYSIFIQILEFVNKQLFNKFLLDEFFLIFLESGSEYVTAVLQNIKKIFVFQISNENEEFFISLIKNFESFTNEIHKVKLWRIQSEALTAMELIIENLYKYVNNSTTLIIPNNNVANINSDDFSTKIFNFIKLFINFDNYQIQTVAISLLTKNLKFCMNKEEIIKYSESEFFVEKRFYKRRLYLIFFHNCLKIFSINYIKEIGMLENIFDFFEDTSINICHLISILPDFYPLINEMSNVKFKLLNKLSDLRKNEKYINDREINRVLNQFNSWEDYYRKNRDNELFKDKLYMDQIKMEDEFKRQYELKLALEGIDKKEADKKKKRNSISVIIKKKVTNTIKSNASSVYQIVPNLINNSLSIYTSNALSPNYLRKNLVRKESLKSVKKTDNINFPIISRANNKKLSVQEKEMNNYLLKNTQFSNSLKIKRNDEKYLIDELVNKKISSSKEISEKINRNEILTNVSYSPVMVNGSRKSLNISNNKFESSKNFVPSKFFLKETINSNNYMSNRNHSNAKRKTENKETSNFKTKNSY